MADHGGQTGSVVRVIPTDPRFDRPGGASWAARAGLRTRLGWWYGLVRVWPTLPVFAVDGPLPWSDDPVAHGLSRELAGLRVTRPFLSVLDVPPSMAEYLRGRSRQALRTNLRRAEESGLRVVVIHDHDEARTVSRQVSAGRRGVSPDVPDDEWFLDHPGDRWFAVVDADGRWVAFAGVAVSTSAALLRILYSATAHPAAGPARYLLHTQVVVALVDAGVQRLWADGPVTTSPGSRYFQRLLGYYCARASIRRRRTGRRPSRRTVGSAA
ncbi:MAG: hypothetical protein ACRYG2_27260 [Janthinobacterium lividum]